jgi:hypothetical protein
VRMTLIFSVANSASKARGNFASRSWIKNRTRRSRSPSAIRRLRACCSIQAVFGLLVQATYSTRRLPIERNTSTYRRRSQIVSTGWVGPGRGAGVTAGPFPRPARRTGRASSSAPGSPQGCAVRSRVAGQALATAALWWGGFVRGSFHGEGMR